MSFLLIIGGFMLLLALMAGAFFLFLTAMNAAKTKK